MLLLQRPRCEHWTDKSTDKCWFLNKSPSPSSPCWLPWPLTSSLQQLGPILWNSPTWCPSRPHSCGQRPRSRHPFPCSPRLAHHCQTVHDPEEGDWKAKKILDNCSHLLNYISHVIVALKYSGGWWGIPVDQRPNSPPLVETGDIVDNISWTEDDDEDFSCEHCQNQKCSPGQVW